MIPPLFFYQLVLIALVWLFLMFPYAWPSDRPPRQSPPARLTRRRLRSTEPKPFAGLTQQPHWVLGEQETVEIAPAPPIPPHPISPTTRRPREGDTSRPFCPQMGCDDRGGLGLGNLRANGHPSGGLWHQWQCRGCQGDFFRDAWHPLPRHTGGRRADGSRLGVPG